MADITVPDVTLPITPAQIGRGIEHIVEQVHPRPRQDLCMRVGEMERRLASYAGDLVNAAYNDAIPAGARDRLARHLYVSSGWGDSPDAGDRWDRDQVEAGIRREFYADADAALKAITSKEQPPCP